MNQRGWYYILDTELKIIHVFANCSGLRMARKYDYTKPFALLNRHDAMELDNMVSTRGYKICHGCYGRETTLARREQRQTHPGFGTVPPGYRHPAPRPKGRTSKPKERDLN